MRMKQTNIHLYLQAVVNIHNHSNDEPSVELDMKEEHSLLSGSQLGSAVC